MPVHPRRSPCLWRDQTPRTRHFGRVSGAVRRRARRLLRPRRGSPTRSCPSAPCGPKRPLCSAHAASRARRMARGSSPGLDADHLLRGNDAAWRARTGQISSYSSPTRLRRELGRPTRVLCSANGRCGPARNAPAGSGASAARCGPAPSSRDALSRARRMLRTSKPTTVMSCAPAVMLSIACRPQKI